MEGEGKEIRTLMGEDFNARMERKGRGVVELIGEKREEEEGRRKSKDKKIDKEGRILVEFMEERN